MFVIYEARVVNVSNLIVITTSVTRLGDFWNFLLINFITRVAQMFADFLDSCEDHRLFSRTGEPTFGNFWKNLDYFLFQQSGRTDYDSKVIL